MHRTPLWLLILTTCFLLPLTSWGANQCGSSRVPINLFQIHHGFDNSGQCLLLKTKSEPNYIAHGIASDRTHLFEDQVAWQEFDYWRFCFDDNQPEKLEALLQDLEEANLLSFEYNNLRYQFGILNSLVFNISRQLRRSHDIQQNGIYYYGLFDENYCPSDDKSEDLVQEYSASALSDYEGQMESLFNLTRILSDHFEVIEHHSFLPSELENLN